MRYFLSSIFICAIAASACSGRSPAQPGASGALVSGQTLSAMDGGLASNVTIQIGSRVEVVSDAGGAFSADLDEAGRYPVVLRGGGFVERKTSLDAPAEGLRLSLIPAGFDLRAFDELCRTANTRLQRWTTQPSLVVFTSAMRFTSMDATEFGSTGERLSDAEVTALIDDLRGALALLTAGRWTDFASVEREDVPESARPSTLRPGKIVAGRYDGVQRWANTIGYGRWAEQADGTVGAGALYLDKDFDAASEHRRLLRTHELGHALGYLHVTARPSIMNPTIGPEPNDFDRQALRIAFDRPVGNKSPDEDPSFGSRPSFATAAGGLRWSAPIP
jgi:hypothetical protein